MKPPALLSALIPVADALDSLRVTWFVGGSLASSARGLARASIDVDLVVDLGPRHVGPLVAALRPSYYVSAESIADAIAERSSFNVIHLDSMLKVDLFVAPGRDFDTAALSRATREALDDESGRTFPVATAEDIVLAKLSWFRSGGERSERQWADVLGVLRASGGALDLDHLERHARGLGVADLLARALDESASIR